VVYLGIIKETREVIEMTMKEYKEMYNETCFETGARPTERGFKEFKAWRKRVEKLFDNISDLAIRPYPGGL
jgi:hypothetical protein